MLYILKETQAITGSEVSFYFPKTKTIVAWQRITLVNKKLFRDNALQKGKSIKSPAIFHKFFQGAITCDYLSVFHFLVPVTTFRYKNV